MVSTCGVSEREFYAVFDSTHECFLAAFDEGIVRVSQQVKEAAECANGWHERVEAALTALLVFFDEEPGWARLLLGGPALDAGADFERRQQTQQVLTSALATETHGEKDRSGWFVPWSEFAGELVVGGVVAVLRKRVREESPEPFVELAPSLMAFIIAQYPGASAINAGPPSPTNDAQADLQRLPVRVTYRTTRVLSAISDAPGLSNRDIAEAAGLSDEGQTSKLLRRLENRCLVQNVGVGYTHGGANAWLLTPYGERVLHATRHSLAPGAGAVMGRRARGTA